MSKHARGWAGIAREVEKWVKDTYPDATYKWVMPLTVNGDGTGGGQLSLRAPGYRAKTQLIYTKEIHGRKTWSA